MDTNNECAKTPEKRRQYKRILDKPLAKKQRRVATTLLDSRTMTEAAQRAGTNEKNIHVVARNEGVRAPIDSKLLSKQAAIAKIEAFCLDIMSREAETPLKHSDKVAAARLLTDIKGVNDTKHTIDVNVGILDLRQASDEELAAELDRIEKSTHSVIDIPKESTHDDSIV